VMWAAFSFCPSTEFIFPPRSPGPSQQSGQVTTWAGTRPVLTTSFGVAIDRDKLIWINGPFPAVEEHDITIFGPQERRSEGQYSVRKMGDW
jgi:hypothetical protein